MKSQRDRDEGTLVINIDLTRGVVAGLAVTAVAAALVGCLAWGQRTASASAKGVSPAVAAASTGLRSYYVTTGFYNGDQADEAGVCAEGYHFASMWEILDPSNLVYDTGLGHARADSGSGPPALVQGWVRTGNTGNGDSTTTGIANCAAWSSSSSSHYGPLARLPDAWLAATDIHVWDVSSINCLVSMRVWCVED